jgi:branched-chain amino acid transport system permease protein
MDPKSWIGARARISPYELIFWVAAAVIPFVFFEHYLSLAASVAVAALFCISLDLILGYAGIISLGHAAFFGIGAYTAGILSARGWGEPISGLALAAVVSALAGYIVSFMIVRVQHLALLMITLGLSFLMTELAITFDQFTGGSDGLQGIDTWKLLGIWKFSLWGHTAYAYAISVLFILFLLARRIVHSPFGLTLEAIRENPVRTTALGAPNRVHLQKIFVISAAFAGVAGALLTQVSETVSPEALGFQRSAEIAVMLILGGTGRLYGAILGAIIFMVARDQISGFYLQYWYFWIGLILIFVVLFMPRGILGGLERLARIGRRS